MLYCPAAMAFGLAYLSFIKTGNIIEAFIQAVDVANSSLPVFLSGQSSR
jgi:hypothetical protein